MVPEPQAIADILDIENVTAGKAVGGVPAHCEFDFKARGKVLSNFVLHYGDFSFKGFRVIQGGDGPWVGFPSVRRPEGKYVTTSWIKQEKRRVAFFRWVLNCYAAAVKQHEADAAAGE